MTDPVLRVSDRRIEDRRVKRICRVLRRKADPLCAIEYAVRVWRNHPDKSRLRRKDRASAPDKTGK